jgi:crossover junction endodeoxyribonuclease RuvC
MTILALDLSLTATDWALSVGEGIEVGTVEGVGNGLQRLHGILMRIQELARGADLVVIEGYSFASRGRSIVSLGELGGVVRHWLHTEGLAWAEVPPANRAKYATGKGNAPKDQVLAEAIRRLGYEGHSHDEADALWLFHMALDHYGLPGAVKMPQANRTASDKIAWPKGELWQM